MLQTRNPNHEVNRLTELRPLILPDKFKGEEDLQEWMEHFDSVSVINEWSDIAILTALTWIQRFKEPEGQIARWFQKLQEYQFTIVHQPSRQHTQCQGCHAISVEFCLTSLYRSPGLEF